MKKVLVLQHMDHDHPGRFLDFFSEDGLLPHAVRLFAGEDIPPLAGYDLMFVLGAAQNTWQQDEYPWINAEKAAIREWVWDRAKPYLGVCFGHQLLATALGGDVAKADKGEVGVFDINHTADGCAHAFLKGMPRTMPVMQWHHAEVKRVPQSAHVLAQSENSAVQAMAIDAHALSTQYHCEFSPQTVAGWASLPGYLAALEREHGPGTYERLRAACYPLMPEMARHTRTMWDNFKRTTGLAA